MFLPTVPTVPHTTILNKTIVYSDTVLTLKNLGKNLKITSIENVNEFFLENCLKTIFESNPNVIFNTIQYSINDEIVYFYTNKDITTKAYEERKFESYKPVNSKVEILEEVKKVLLSQENKDNNCISLYDVFIVLENFSDEYHRRKKEYENSLDYAVKNKIDYHSSVRLSNINFRKKTIEIAFSYYRHFDNIYFTKQNGDLYITKSESAFTNEVFSALSSILSEMYDELSTKYVDYQDYKYDKENIKPVNSNFNINIDCYGIEITDKYSKELLVANSYKGNYELKCNSSIVNEAFNGKESEILKKIFVKISDCPEWSQAMLYEMRQKQLAKEQKKDFSISKEIKFKI